MPPSDQLPPTPSSTVMAALPLAILGVLMAVVVKRFASPVTNPDTFFHLRLGQEFVDGWKPWAPGSVTSHATADWAPTQWLSQVLYAGAEELLGLPGVAWLTGTVVLAHVLVVYLVARRLGGPLVAALVTCLAVLGSLPSLSSRPQVASYLFVVLVTAAWLRVGRGGRLPWWTIPLTWLWAMVHGMWISGVVVGLAAALALTLDRREDPSRVAHPVWAPWLVPALSFVAAGMTPVGPSLWAGTWRVGGISEFFAEWGPADFTVPTTAAAALMLALTLLIRLRRGGGSWLELCLIALAGAWMLYAHRSVPTGVAMLVPLLALSLETLVPQRRGARWESRAVVVLGVAASALLAVLVPSLAESPPREDSAVSAEVAALPSGTTLLNDWELGGTDLWLYPHLDVVMHGYGDMFTRAELQRNLDIRTLEPGWDDAVREVGATHALVRSDSALAYALEHGEGWTVQAEDEELSYLVAPEGWRAESAG